MVHILHLLQVRNVTNVIAWATWLETVQKLKNVAIDAMMLATNLANAPAKRIKLVATTVRRLATWSRTAPQRLTSVFHVILKDT